MKGIRSLPDGSIAEGDEIDGAKRPLYDRSKIVKVFEDPQDVRSWAILTKDGFLVYFHATDFQKNIYRVFKIVEVGQLERISLRYFHGHELP